MYWFQEHVSLRRSTEFLFANLRSEEHGGEEEGYMFLPIIVAFRNMLHLADRLRFRSPIRGGRGMAVQKEGCMLPSSMFRLADRFGFRCARVWQM